MTISSPQPHAEHRPASFLGSESTRLPANREPRWVQPAFIGILALAAALLLWELSDNGWANAYYSGAVGAAAHSWSAFWTASLDASRTVSVDKPPLGIWMMALSARAFGFSPAALLVPNALCTLGSVALVYALSRRAFSYGVALLAALFMALTPVTIAVGRFNNPDALLVLLLLAAAWWAVRTGETGRSRYAVLCGMFVGLAFNTKMLQAYLVLPALGVAVLIGGSQTRYRRWRLVAAASLTLLVVSSLWIGAMSLLPGGARPWVGDTTNDSWWQLTLGANGVGRLSGASAAARAGAGPLRLLEGATGGQIAWLLPLALSGVLLGVHRARSGTAALRANIWLWLAWAAVHLTVFSLLLGLFHAYYTSALAPALAVLAALGAAEMWRKRGCAPIIVLIALPVLAGTLVLALTVLRQTPHFVPWLPWCLVTMGVLTVGLMVLAANQRPALWSSRAAATGMLVCALAGPAAYSLATTSRELGGIDPQAGPGSYEEPLWASGDAGGQRRLIRYLAAHRGGARYIAAVSGALAAAPLSLLSRSPVLTMGGFAGSDPAPTATQLASVVARGQVTSIVLTSTAVASNGASTGGLGGDVRRNRWVTQHCERAALALVLPAPTGWLHAQVYRCGASSRSVVAR